MKVLVTGGAGYIGSVTSRALIDAGHTLTVLDDLTTGHADAVAPEARFVEGSVSDAQALREALSEGVDACVHFAARIEAGESMRSPERFFSANTAGSLRLLEGLVEAGVGRFVFSSTAAVYGEPRATPIGEDHPLQPTNTYGESKLLVERALPWLHRLRGLRYAVLRYFNASGATEELGERHDPETHLIPLVLAAAVGAAPEALIYGDDYPTRDGTCVRDYVHVADLASAHVRALDALRDHATITCNLGNGRGFTVHEVIEACRRVTGADIRVRVVPRRPGDPPELLSSARRAQQLLKWEPTIPDLEDIVASAWRWSTRTGRHP
jgi:UDP-glucose 4-epimerase